ncbi:hypothetical protein J7D37_04270 [Acinetobacter baumannii]|uniref:hypothetical protein n=1 Tax=Acinetobacter baumannii TaxID=470 RepID=UPI000571CA02|nr:hypothetical protein [Acinetobacter baumannii]MDC4312840.1 hypothetical protein [Acinetobacter baumannii]MDO7407922.1 hypothetical protein [Acinetobacter baumannii]QTM20895.1 hypothetical protein J7D37_04270 [Acinetobacter baumannii]TPU29180.1 hypothetical protein FJU85_13490 [Acinetobacter baumannii]
MWQCLPKEQVFGLMSSFSIVEASALIAGHPPSSCAENTDWNGNPDGTYYLANASEHEKIVFDAALSSITHDIEIGELKAIIKTEAMTQLYKSDTQDDWQAKAILSIFQTRIKRNDLVKWLADRHCYPDFFFSNKNEPPYLIQNNNPQYSPKLCAVIHAWEATKEAEENNNLDGMSVKKYASNWLENNAQKYGVEGVTNYDDMAAIVNWNTKGGRVSEKPTLTKDEPTPILEKGKIALSDDDVNSAVIDTLLIEKTDLVENPYKINSNKPIASLDDDLPF